MAMINFTSNYTDRSNDTGFQFEFHCDKCGNGFMSTFKANKIGMAGGIFRALGSLFSGNDALDRLGSASDHAKDALRGKAWDDAYAAAVTEGKQHFKQCTRCGKWVCPENCWNHDKGLCEHCAPDLQEELASAQATAAREQVWDKARNADLVEDVDVKTPAKLLCPHCGAKSTGGKFCNDCGKPLAAEVDCPRCGNKVKPGIKFCNECGQKMVG